MISLLQKLAAAADLPIDGRGVYSDQLLERAYATASEFYPELIADDVNPFPAWLGWLSPQPVWKGSWIHRATTRLNNALSPAARRAFRWRKQLSAFFAVRNRLPLGATEMLLADDAEFSRHAQRLLIEHRVPFDVPLLDLLDHSQLPQTLAAAIVRAVSRGQDNELFVLFADLIGRLESLTSLLKAIRLARARHHHVMVVQPWPAELPGPEVPLPELPKWPSARDLVAHADSIAWKRGWRSLREKCARAGATLVCANERDPARIVLHRLDQMRTVQSVVHS